MTLVYLQTEGPIKSVSESQKQLPFRDSYFVNDSMEWIHYTPERIQEVLDFWSRPYVQRPNSPDTEYKDFCWKRTIMQNFWSEIHKTFPDGVWVMFSY